MDAAPVAAFSCVEVLSMKRLGILAQAVEDSDSHIWWLIFAGLIAMTLCWCILSVTNREKTNSLWKDEDTEMDSSSDPYRGG
jgi:hypothetical protein